MPRSITTEQALRIAERRQDETIVFAAVKAREGLRHGVRIESRLIHDLLRPDRDMAIFAAGCIQKIVTENDKGTECERLCRIAARRRDVGKSVQETVMEIKQRLRGGAHVVVDVPSLAALAHGEPRVATAAAGRIRKCLG